MTGRMDLTDVPQKRTLLTEHDFFRGMPADLVERLAARARLTSEPAGRVLFRKGDAGTGLLAVVSGIVRISVSSGEGNDIVLNLVAATRSWERSRFSTAAHGSLMRSPQRGASC